MLQTTDTELMICANDPNSCDRLPGKSGALYLSFAILLVIIGIFFAMVKYISTFNKPNGSAYDVFNPADVWIGAIELIDWIASKKPLIIKYFDNLVKKNADENEYEGEDGMNLANNAISEQIDPIGGFYEPKSLVVQSGVEI